MSNTTERTPVKKGQWVHWETKGRGKLASWRGMVVYQGKPYKQPNTKKYNRKNWWRKEEFKRFAEAPSAATRSMSRTFPDGIIVRVEDKGVKGGYRYMTPRLGSLI